MKNASDNFSYSRSELMQEINALSPYGTVLTKSRMDKYLSEGGACFTTGQGKIHILKFLSYVYDSAMRKRRHAAMTYEEMKESARNRIAERSVIGRDIGDLPPVLNAERKSESSHNFRLFCENYFPDTFSLGWSSDHLKAIRRIESAVLEGGLFALAMPRGSGKSMLSETAVLWALLYGHREFVTLFGSTEQAAVESLGNIKTELESNDLLLEDFPEAVYPIRALEGISNRCAGQLYQGERTRITWTNNEIILPMIRGSASSGVIVRVAGLTGNIRGMRYKRPDGKPVRPSLVVIDDPQTRESASSIEQTRKRSRVLFGDILGLAGPGQKICGIMPCTIIRIGDLADQVLDRQKHPEWNGERMKMLYEEPSDKKLWEQYAEIRAESLRTDGNIDAATEFYRKHRQSMDAGAVVSWEARFNHDEISALQHAMNLKFQDEAAFAAEYQNEPLAISDGMENEMSADEICAKINGLDYAIAPLYSDRLTMFVDVQKDLLFYLVTAWKEDFTGAVIDYGTWPGQKREVFTLADADPTLGDIYPGTGLEGSIYQGLKTLMQKQCKKEYRKEDGSVLKLERVLIDANWGQSTGTVYQFCRESEYSNILLPSHGKYIGADSKPMWEYRRKPGMRLGFNWFMPPMDGSRAIRHVIYDTNYWKSFVLSRLLVPNGDKSSLSLYGRHPERHELLARHLTAEYKVRTIGRGREVDEWKIRPNHDDNHWLDCLVGATVAASITGCDLPEARAKTAMRQTPMKLTSLKDKGIEKAAETAPEQSSGGRITLSELYKQKH